MSRSKRRDILLLAVASIFVVLLGFCLRSTKVAATNTSPIQVVSALPAVCNTGETYLLTTATAGQNLYVCTSTNTFTAISTGAAQPIQNGTIVFCSSTTGNDSYACNFSPAFTSYAGGACTSADVGKICDGTVVNVLVDTANTGAATFAPNGLAAKQIKKNNNKNLKNDDIGAGGILALVYQRTQDVWQWQSQVSNQVTVVSGAVQQGAFGSLPTCNDAATGLLYLFTSALYDYANCDGTNWAYWGMGRQMVPPDSSTFTWINQGGASVDTTYGGFIINAPVGTINLRIRKMVAPATPYHIEVGFIPTLYPASNSSLSGLLFRDSVSGNLVSWHVDQALLHQVNYYNSPTSVNTGNVFSTTSNMSLNNIVWYRIGDDGTGGGAARTFDFSYDGKNWVNVASQGRTVFITPDEVGFFLDCENAASKPCYSAVVWWRATV